MDEKMRPKCLMEQSLPPDRTIERTNWLQDDQNGAEKAPRAFKRHQNRMNIDHIVLQIMLARITDFADSLYRFICRATRATKFQTKHASLLHVQASKHISPGGGPSSKIYTYIYIYIYIYLFIYTYLVHAKNACFLPVFHFSVCYPFSTSGEAWSDRFFFFSFSAPFVFVPCFPLGGSGTLWSLNFTNLAASSFPNENLTKSLHFGSILLPHVPGQMWNCTA